MVIRHRNHGVSSLKYDRKGPGTSLKASSPRLEHTTSGRALRAAPGQPSVSRLYNNTYQYGAEDDDSDERASGAETDGTSRGSLTSVE